MFPKTRLVHLFAAAIALGLALLVTGIPLVQVTHSHAPDTHQCADDHHHDTDTNGHDHSEHCGLCLYFAHFFPSISPLGVWFSFLDGEYAFATDFHIPETHRVAEGNRSIQANKGPPEGAARRV